MSSISVGIITVGLSTVGDRSENDRLRGTHYLDRPMSKWKYCMRTSAYFFLLSWAVRGDVFFFFFLLNQIPQIERVRTWTGNALQLPSAEEKPVRGQGWQEEGSRHISIFISFSGTFTELLLVSLLYRACYGSLVLASCPLTTLAALMVVCGKLSTAFSLLVCAYVSHSSSSGADRWYRPERGQCERKGRLRPTLVYFDIYIISLWLDSYKVHRRQSSLGENAVVMHYYYSKYPQLWQRKLIKYT